MALDYSALGKRISNFRNASGFTQEQFCEKLNMSRKHISQIEAPLAVPVWKHWLISPTFSAYQQTTFS